MPNDSDYVSNASPAPVASDPAAPATPATPATPAAPTNYYEGGAYKAHYAGNETLFEKYKSEDEFVKGGLEAMKLVGKKGQYNIEVPEKDDPNYGDKMTAVFDKLGRGSRPEDYEITMMEVPKELEDRITFSDTLKTGALELAAKHRISQDALNDLAALQQASVIEHETAFMKTRLEAAEKVEAELAKDANFETDKALVDRLISQTDGLAAELDVTGWGNSPGLFRILAAHARETIAEGDIDTPGPATGGGGAQATDAMKEERIKDETEFPYSPYSWRHKDKFGAQAIAPKK